MKKIDIQKITSSIVTITVFILALIFTKEGKDIEFLLSLISIILIKICDKIGESKKVD